MIKNNEKYIIDLMDRNPSIVKETIFNAIKKLNDATVEVILQWRKENPEAEEADCISQCNLQMVTSTVESILLLAEGIHWGKFQTFLIDINACASLVRSLYERVFIYRNIYISTDNTVERDLLLYIWEIRGLNNRLNLKNVPEEFVIDQGNDRQEVAKLRKCLYTILRLFFENLLTAPRSQVFNPLKI